MRVLIAALVLACASSVEAANLYVNNSGSPSCSDATVKASNSAGSPWCTLGRAVWGNADRESPSTAQAADVGDIVYVTGGTYATTEGPYSAGAWTVLYNPVNQGTLGNPIRFVCVGNCYINAINADTAGLGSDSQDYIEWFADVMLGYSWNITACGLTTYPTGCPAQPYISVSDEPGPVTCHDAIGCKIEGFVINGGPQTDWTSNWSGIRLENCTDCYIANNNSSSFFNSTLSVNGTSVTVYGSIDTILENNYLHGSTHALNFKDAPGSPTMDGVIVRYNKLYNVQACFYQTMTAQPRNDVYQNVCYSTSQNAIIVTGGGYNGVWYYNNTFYDMYGLDFRSGASSGGSALPIRFWNNIYANINSPIAVTGATMPSATTVATSQHNVYYNYSGNFYSGSDGTRTIASYLAAFTDQDQTAPASITTNPLFVSAGTGDFRLCTGVNTPAVGCSGASPAINLGRAVDGGATINAGAYLTNTECIGLESLCSAVATAPVRLRRAGE